MNDMTKIETLPSLKYPVMFRWLSVVPLWCAGVVSSLSIFVLIGSIFEIAYLKRIIPGSAVMNTTTTVTFILSSVALWLLQSTDTRRIRVAQACAAMIALTGFIKLCAIAGFFDLGIDRILFRDRLFDTVIGQPNRMNANTALNFLLFGAALLLFNARTKHESSFPSQFPAIAVFLTSFLAIIDYFYDANSIKTIVSVNPMTIYAAGSFFVLAVGLLLAKPERGIIKEIFSTDAGGGMARRLFPLVIIVPALFGWLQLYGEKRDFFENEMGTAILIIGIISILSVIILSNARLMNIGSSRRRQTEEALKSREAQLAEAQRIAHLGSWEWDIKTNKLFLSDEGFRIFGLDPRESGVTYEAYMEYVHPDDRESVAGVIERSIQEKEYSGYEHRIVRHDGALRTIHADGRIILDQNGEPVKILGIMLDITDRQHAQHAALENEEKYRNIVETANEGIWLIDFQARITYVNRQMAEMLGYEVDEMIGRTIFDFIFEEDFSLAKHKIEQRKTGSSETDEFRLRRKDGSEIITLYNAAPTKNQAGEIIGFLSMNTDITERKTAEEFLRKQKEILQQIFDHIPVMISFFDKDGRTKLVNRKWEHVLGWTMEEIEDQDLDIMAQSYPNSQEHQKVQDFVATATGEWTEFKTTSKDGQVIDTAWAVVKLSDGTSVGIGQDITERKRAEDALNESEKHLRQAQKLESVGLLAGGIAHDFNNMLTAITGYSDLTLRKLETDSPLRRNIEEIKKAGERSASLTHQLLAFSRQQVLQPVVIDINEAISNTVKMLQRLIGEDIRLTTTLNPKVGRVKVDPGQFSQIIMNLAVNARDAMPQGGRLTIETANIFLDSDYARQHVGFLPGNYVQLAVSDTGTGMSYKTKQHIFEPFFTTKEIGQGTGLGLATVYGIVKQSGGNIEVYSEEGIGTTFKLYLPQVTEQVNQSEERVTSPEMPEGTEKILLVEDEEQVRNLSREILETCGYTVIVARDGLEAWEICEKGDCKIDLLMTDIVMPQMGGRELAEKFAAKLPNLHILFSSGYTDDAVVRHGVIESNTNFIQKPFTPESLANKIREILDNFETS